MFLIYNPNGDIQAFDSNEPLAWPTSMKSGYFNFNDVEVNPEYVEELKKNTNYVDLSPEMVVMLRLFFTFLLSENGQKIIKNIANWFYKLLLKGKVNKFVNKYYLHTAILSKLDLDGAKAALYNESVEMLTNRLNDTQKRILIKSFNGEL